MEGGDAVDVLTDVGGEVGHAHACPAFGWGDAHAFDLLVIGTELLFFCGGLVGDLLDDLVVAWQQGAEELGVPYLECFWKERVARVVERAGGDGEGGVPVVAVDVEEQAHEFGDGDHRVRVVELEDDLVWECCEIWVFLTWVEEADGVGEGSGREEVLLFEAQALANFGGIFWVENLGDVFGVGLTLDGVIVARFVEGLEVEFVDCFCAPQAKRVDAAGFESWYEHVVRKGAY